MKLYSNAVLHVRVGACACALTGARARTYICMCDYYVLYIQLYVRAQCVPYVRAYVHAYVYVWPTYVHANVYAYMCVGACVYATARV